MADGAPPSGPSGPAGPPGAGDRRRRRRRRRGGGGGGGTEAQGRTPQQESPGRPPGPTQAASPPPARPPHPRREERERPRREERERPRREERDRPRQPQGPRLAPASAPFREPEPAAAQAEPPDPEAGAAAERTIANERWGDDSDAPTPEIRLAPDLPVEPFDADGEHVFTDELEEGAAQTGVVVNVCGVKISAAGKIHEVDAGDGSFARGDQVLVETDRGPRQATVAIASRREVVSGRGDDGQPLRRILRRADARDDAATERNVRRAAEALAMAKQRARAKNLPIKVFRAELSAGGSKALFYFASEERIDFRDLVRDVGQQLRMRVEMRQTGARDEAKLTGGIGSCGRELCCTTFLPHFEPVSIKMAKDQGLVLNPSKVSGQCGRLKCCLVYEEATYREMRKGLPKLGKRVTTPAGEGRVAEVDVLRRRIRVAFEPGEFQTFPADAVAQIVLPPGGAPRPAPPPGAPVDEKPEAEAEPEPETEPEA